MNTPLSVEVILNSPYSNFYKNILQGNSVQKLEEFPILTWENLVETPFLERLYRREGLFTKIVMRNNRTTLIGRTGTDIALESYGGYGERPLVTFVSLHESLEKSMWLLTRNILPLINDRDNDITVMTAVKYQIDSVLADMTSLKSISERLSQRYDISRIKHITVIDDHFDTSFLEDVYAHADITLTLALPECGAIATKKQESNEFVVDTTCTIERSQRLVVTKNILLPTPIIRYQTAIPVAILES